MEKRKKQGSVIEAVFIYYISPTATCQDIQTTYFKEEFYTGKI